MQTLSEFNRGYPTLYPERIDDEDDGGRITRHPHAFEKHFGWYYSATQIANENNISIDDAWEMPVAEALYVLTYLKVKRDYEREMLDDARKNK